MVHPLVEQVGEGARLEAGRHHVRGGGRGARGAGGARVRLARAQRRRAQRLPAPGERAHACDTTTCSCDATSNDYSCANRPPEHVSRDRFGTSVNYTIPFVKKVTFDSRVRLSQTCREFRYQGAGLLRFHDRLTDFDETCYGDSLNPEE